MPPESPNGDLTSTEAPSVNTPESLPGGPSAPGPAADGKPSGAESSPAAKPGETKPASVYDAVLAALGDKGEASDADAPGGESPPPASAEVQGSTESGDGKTGAGAQPDPEPKASERLRELLAERKQILPRAQQFEQLGQWMRSQGVTQERFTAFMGLAALRGADPAQARQHLLAMAAEIEQELGINELPPDIQQSLDQGRIDEEYARELALTRRGNYARNERQRQIAEQNAIAQQQVHAQREAVERSSAIGMAVTNVERSLEKNGPDYPRIRQYVTDRVKVLLNEGQIPATPEEAVKQFRDAYDTVKRGIVAQQGRRPGITPLDRGDRGGSSMPAPTSAFEAAQRALAATQS